MTFLSDNLHGYTAEELADSKLADKVTDLARSAEKVADAIGDNARYNRLTSELSNIR